MFYIYLIRSIKFTDQTYIGFTTNVHERLNTHNNGGAIHTTKFKPWELVSYVALTDEARAREFEKYIKIGSGHAFAKRRLW